MESWVGQVGREGPLLVGRRAMRRKVLDGLTQTPTIAAGSQSILARGAKAD